MRVRNLDQARNAPDLGVAGEGFLYRLRQAGEIISIARRWTQAAACEVCGAPLRRVKSLQAATTNVRFCSRGCRHRRHRRLAA